MQNEVNGCYSNAGTLSGTRMSLADRRTFTSPMSAPFVFQSRPAIPLPAKSSHMSKVRYSRVSAASRPSSPHPTRSCQIIGARVPSV
jgi:hypothetical protein